MPKYIDFDALGIGKARRDVFNDPAYADGWNSAIEIVLTAPAADVAEVRHGRWIEQSPDFDLCGVAYYKCSECGKEQQLNSHYCQFCGAKMDGDGE